MESFSFQEVKQTVNSIKAKLRAAVRENSSAVCDDLREIVHPELVQQLIFELVTLQQERNERKAREKATQKTVEQTAGYIQRIFSGSEEDCLKNSALMLAYVQEKEGDGSFMGLERYLKSNADKPMKEIAEKYYEAVWKSEREQIYDLINRDSWLGEQAAG